MTVGLQTCRHEKTRWEANKTVFLNSFIVL